MVRLALILTLACTGCTITKFPRAIGGWRISFMQRIEMPEVEVLTNGTVRLLGYRSDGGSDAAAKIAGAVAEGTVKGMKASGGVPPNTGLPP